MMKRAVISALLCASVLAVYGETIRGPVVAMATIRPSEPSGVEQELALDEILVTYLDADPRFFEGLEIMVHVPASVREQPGNVSLSGLVSLTPEPMQQVMSLRGAQIISEPLLRTQRVYFRIPLYPGVAFRASADTTVLDQAVPPESFPLAITLTDVGKGGTIPRETTRFTVHVSPLLRDRGAVSLRFYDESGDRFFVGDEELGAVDVAIDGQRVTIDGAEIVLATGLHEIHLTSDVYLESSQTFGVERGRVLELSVLLVRPKATVRLDAPKGAEIFVDGRKVEGPVTELPEGEHVALVRIGDYSVSRRFTVEREKSYIISVSLDIIVNEVD